MKLKLLLYLEKEQLPIQYRKSILSFIKMSLEKYDKKYYEKFYHDKDPIIKDYTFAVFFNSKKFLEDEILLNNKMLEIIISIASYENAIILYNALNHQKNLKFSLNKNSWVLKKINLLKEKKIEKEEILIKFLSPLVVRKRENNKDYYYSFNHEEFLDTLKINIKEQLKITKMPQEIAESINIKPIMAKKVIIKFYEKKIETSIGIFMLSGNKQLLEYLYQSGMGSKHSSGFGMFEII